MDNAESREAKSERTDTRIRPAVPADAPAIAAVHAEAIAERQATFDPAPSPPEEMATAIATEDRRLLVAERDGEVVGWAGLSPYSTRDVYAGVAECSVYVSRAARGTGVGGRLVEALAATAERDGLYKLIGKVFPTNRASVRLLQRCGFREVGLHRHHGRLDGEWRDVLLVERLLGPAAAAARRRA